MSKEKKEANDKTARFYAKVSAGDAAAITHLAINRALKGLVEDMATLLMAGGEKEFLSYLETATMKALAAYKESKKNG